MRNLITLPVDEEPVTGSRVLPFTAGPRTYTVEEAASVLGISRSHAYACARTGELPSLRLRRRIVVPAHALEMMLTTGDR